MIQKLKTIILSLASVVAMGILVAPAISYAGATASPTVAPDVSGSVCGGAQTLQFNQAAACDSQTSENNLNNFIATVINILSVIVGVIAVIMIIVGGFKYITSGGDSTKVGSAKNTILYALIGLVIVAVAQVIVKFVLTKASTTIQ